MNFIDKVKAINLSEGSYIIVGSGILDVLGIRDANDVDIVVSEDVYKELKNSGFEEIEVEYDGVKKKLLIKDDYEVLMYWRSPRGDLFLEDLLEDSQIVDGVTFVSLEMLIRWKKWSGRDKDIVDVELANKYLKNN